jgi:hypothetical protein
MKNMGSVPKYVFTILIVSSFFVICIEVGVLFLLNKETKRPPAPEKAVAVQQKTVPQPKPAPICESYVSAISNLDQKKYLADVSEGFVAYERGVITDIENSVTWKGKINKILVDQTYKTKSCVPGQTDSCKNVEIPNTSLIELISPDGKATDVPLIFTGKLNPSTTTFYLYKKNEDTYDAADFTSVVAQLSLTRNQILIRRKTLFNPLRREFYIKEETNY